MSERFVVVSFVDLTQVVRVCGPYRSREKAAKVAASLERTFAGTEGAAQIARIETSAEVRAAFKAIHQPPGQEATDG